MMLIKTYVAPSTIQGTGVFADEFVAKGTLIWRLHEKLDVQMSAGDIAKLPPHMQEFIRIYSYPNLEREGYVIVDSDNGRFMNHADAPNTDFRDFNWGYALADIQRGDELTCDYGELFPNWQGFGPGGHEMLQPVVIAADTVIPDPATLPLAAQKHAYGRRQQGS